MNECLMIPQHEKQIDFWVSKKGKCKWNGYQLKNWNVYAECII